METGTTAEIWKEKKQQNKTKQTKRGQNKTTGPGAGIRYKMENVYAYPSSILQPGHREDAAFDLGHLGINTDVKGAQVGVIVEVSF